VLKIVVSIKTLRIHERNLTDLKNKLKIKNTKVLKSVKKGGANFDDVKLRIVVNNNKSSCPVYDAYVSTKNSNYKKLSLEPRFVESLYLLAKAVHDGKDYVSNYDIKEKCNDGANKVKLEIIKAFEVFIKERAQDIIGTKHGIGKVLKIPKKNITINISS